MHVLTIENKIKFINKVDSKKRDYFNGNRYREAMAVGVRLEGWGPIRVPGH